MEHATDSEPESDTAVLPPVSGRSPTSSDACCKVQRVTAAYNLSGIDGELQRRYEIEDATLHELADYVNDRLTGVTLDAIHGAPEIEPATVRAALQGDEGIPATERDDIRATLAGQIDVDVLTDSFVSHETVRRHLNEHLDVSTSRGGFESFEELSAALDAYQEQYENGVERALERAGEKGIIAGTSFRIFSTRVECEQCSNTYRLRELLRSGGCDCQNS